MADFFVNMEPRQAQELQLLSRLAYDLRESRAGLLRHYEVGDEAALLERIVRGDLAEHPAYEHYLAARVLEHTRQAAREQMAGRQAPAVSHLLLREHIEECFSGQLAGGVELTQDALLVRLCNGIVLTAYVAAADEYAFVWQRGDDAATQQRIDTAPVHPGMVVHRHLDTGRVVADTITDPAAAPADNLGALLAQLLI